MSVKTIEMEPLRNHLKYVLYSGFIENKQRPLSTLVIAYPERAKSTEASRFRAIGATEVQDLSSHGILHELASMTPNERKVFHHIIVPDLEKLASRSKRLKEELLSTIRILTEEGFGESWVKYQRFRFKEKVVIGFILCTTPEDLGDRRSAFRSYSFLSRFLPFTYDYSKALKLDILKYVQSEDRLAKTKIEFKREEPAEVICPDHIKLRLDPYVSIIATEVDEFSTKSSIPALTEKDRKFGVRFKENLITYLKSIALYDGYTTVREKHFERFEELFPFMNFQFNNIDEAEMLKRVIATQLKSRRSSNSVRVSSPLRNAKRGSNSIRVNSPFRRRIRE
jgi:hypothetical protein